jgi:hypothetical protein
LNNKGLAGGSYFLEVKPSFLGVKPSKFSQQLRFSLSETQSFFSTGSLCERRVAITLRARLASGVADFLSLPPLRLNKTVHSTGNT